VAGWGPLPSMSGDGPLGHGTGLASLSGMRSADLGDSRDLICGLASAVAPLVRSNLARDQPGKWGQRPRQRVLGLGSYRTAWNLLHKLRRAMVRPVRERLNGIVEVDEIFIGGPRPGRRSISALSRKSRAAPPSKHQLIDFVVSQVRTPNDLFDWPSTDVRRFGQDTTAHEREADK
jgi:hypothetical protein